jgi:hypothetical protein
MKKEHLLVITLVLLVGGIYAYYQFGNSGNNPANYGGVWNWLTNKSGS